MALDPPSSSAPTHTRPVSRLWYTHSFDQPILYTVVRNYAPLLPRRVRLGMARVTASLFRPLMPREYAAARANLARVLPDASADAVAHTARCLFRNFAYYFADLLTLNRQPLAVQQRHMHSINGFDHLDAILKAGQGFIAATAHLGNWELAGRLLVPFGKTIHVLVAREHHAAVQRLLREQDCPAGLRFVLNDDAGAFLKLLMALRRGEVVAVQLDRVTGHRSDTILDFFNAPAAFPSGPFKLAAVAQVPIIPFFCLMRPDYRYDIYIGEAIPVARGHERDAMWQMVRVLEHYVAKAPDQWFNFYDVWAASPTLPFSTR